ncbi:MAG: CoA-binding protein [Bacillota bacterium]
MEQTKKTMLEQKVWAVVGATPNTTKFGNKIYNKLKSRGYEVYAVNPNYDEVEGDKCYHGIDELPVKPNCVNMVVSPHISKNFIEDIVKAGIKYVWFQPGSFDEETISMSEENGLDIVYYDCVLVALG